VNLRAVRTAAGLTVRELAARAGIANVLRADDGAAKLRAVPSSAVLERLARALGTTVGVLRG
jgi:transcriptional regulator with XRE-family HTH domain